ncbi:Alkylglycerol monooxygenase, partial [Stegodyphus mimosarum]
MVLPHYMILFLLEAAVAAYLKKPVFRVNDSIVSASQGFLQQISFIAFRGIQHAAYFFIYSHWRLVTLPWNSIWTWWLCFLAEDFTFYWLHRACHGKNRYCIDKNYGGVLIIWDRIFGTFQAEEEEVVYGLTHPVNSFEPIYIQAKAPDVKYDPHVPLSYKLYALLHFGVLFLAYAEITTRSLLLPQSILYVVILHQVLSLSAIGMILEGR